MVPITPFLYPYLCHQDQIELALTCQSSYNSFMKYKYSSPVLDSCIQLEKLLVNISKTPKIGHYVESIVIQESFCNVYLGDLNQLLSSCPFVTTFSITNANHLSNFMIKSLVTHGSALRNITLSGIPISDKLIPSLTLKCVFIQKLDLSFSFVSCACILPILQNCNCLIELDLSGSLQTQDESLASTYRSLHGSTTTHVTPLTILNLKSSQISNIELSYISTVCPNLQEVDLESCTFISDESLLKLVKNCPLLKSLDVSFCDLVTDKLLNLLSILSVKNDSQGHLKELNLAGCECITPKAIHQLVIKIPGLRLLILDGCSKIINSFVSKFALIKSKVLDVECILDKDGIVALGSFSPSTTTPPSITEYSEYSESMENVKESIETIKKEKDTLHPLKTLTRRASRIIKQKSTPHLSLQRVELEANAFHQERIEKIKAKQCQESPKSIKSLGKLNILQSDDYVLLASGRTNSRLHSPQRSTDGSQIEKYEFRNPYTPPPTPIPEDIPSCPQTIQEPILKLNLEIRKNVYKSLEIYSIKDKDDSIESFCKEFQVLHLKEKINHWVSLHLSQ